MFLFPRTTRICRSYYSKLEPHIFQQIRTIRYINQNIESADHVNDGPNRELLNHLLNYYKEEKILKPNLLKHVAILKAIKSIHQLDFRLTLKHNPQSIPGVDEKVMPYIIEFLTSTKTDKRRLIVQSKPQAYEEINKIRTIRQLQEVNGIGPIKAHLLWAEGCRSLSQLLGNERYLKLLPEPTQKIIKYEMVSNTEITAEHADRFLSYLRKILAMDFEIHLVGRHRLGRKKFKELDILLFHPSYTSLPWAISKLKHDRRLVTPSIYRDPPESLFEESVVNVIRKHGLEAITYSSSTDQWDGVLKVDDEVMTRTRIYFMSMASKAAALLILTGNAVFASRCRKKATMNRLHLNEFGLWRVATQVPPGSDWELLTVPDETALLEHLKMPYIEPHQREKYVTQYIRPGLLQGPWPPWHNTKSIPAVIQDVVI